MDPSASPERTGVRFSESPALTPQLIDAPDSPVRSVHIEKHLAAMQADHTDKSHENSANFFDDGTSDEDESALLPDPSSTDFRASMRSETLPPEHIAQIAPDEPDNLPPQRPPRPSARNSSISQPQEHETAEEFDNNEEYRITDWSSEPSMPNGFGNNRSSKVANRPLSMPPDATRDILNAHAITLQALLQNSGIDSQQALIADLEPSKKSDPATNRKINIIPPALSISPKRTKQPIVRTPFPLGIRKSILRQSHISINPGPSEAILALTLRRRHDHKSWKVTELKIPASPDNVPIVSEPTESKPQQSEKHFETLDFDDAHFFRQLSISYARLAGPLRHFSARGLHHIEVSHSDACTVCESADSHHTRSGSFSCQHELPRSPMRVVSQGLSDSFSEANLMAYYRNPTRGKTSYMWVHWAHRLASTPAHLLPPAPPPVGAPSDGTDSRRPSVLTPQIRTPTVDEKRIAAGECVAGLEFVQGWVAWKIALATIGSLLLAVAATLLWIIVGVSARHEISSARDRAGRIIAGCLLGGLVLLLEMVVVAVWIGVSWLMD